MTILVDKRVNPSTAVVVVVVVVVVVSYFFIFPHPKERGAVTLLVPFGALAEVSQLFVSDSVRSLGDYG